PPSAAARRDVDTRYFGYSRPDEQRRQAFTKVLHALGRRSYMRRDPRRRESEMVSSIRIVAACVAACWLAAGAALAQDCPRGELDKAYCDRNGDMVADAPTDPKQFVDPPTLIFAYTPVEDPAVYAKVWDGFVKHMEKTTGKKVVFFPVQS